MEAFNISVNFFSFLYEYLPLTSAVDAVISIIIGASTIRANEPAIPKAARLYLASPSLAIKAIRKGCSKDIISHVRARGTQKRNIFLDVSWSEIFTYMHLRSANIIKKL